VEEVEEVTKEEEEEEEEEEDNMEEEGHEEEATVSNDDMEHGIIVLEICSIPHPSPPNNRAASVVISLCI